MEWILMPVRKLYPAIAGRSRRKEFWAFFAFNVLLVVAFLVLFGGMFAGIAANPESSAVAPAVGVGFVLLIILMIPLGLWMYVAAPALIAVMARRLHDQNRSAWLMLLALIPYLGFLVLLIFMCIEGTPGPNNYGPDPKSASADAVFS